jgi:hypothetical protein
MSPRFSIAIMLFAAAVFIAGLTWLFQLRVGQGDVFPPYSTLRADPLGTRALYESLQELPGLQVERSLKPIKKLGGQPARTIVFAGIRRQHWEGFSTEEANALDAAVSAGSRVLIVFRAEGQGIFAQVESLKRQQAEEEKAAEKKAAEKKKAQKEQGAESEESASPAARTSPRNDEGKFEFKVEQADWVRRWGLEPRNRWIMDRNEGARRHALAPQNLPLSVKWKSDVYFHLTQGSDWEVVYTRGSSPVMVEMKRGLGSVVIAGDAYFLSNEAMQKDRALDLLTWAIGGNARVVFMESHLGVEEDVGIAKLARRYGLAGAFFMLLLLTALFVWQRMALFVPPAPESAETALTYHPSAGLEALLRRALPAGKLVETCVAEWTRTVRASQSDKARVSAVAQNPKASPADNYNAVVRALRRR